VDGHRFAALALILALSAAGCSGKTASAPPLVPASLASGPPVAFSYEALSGKPLSTESVAGRVTVIGFIATYDLHSQAEVRFLTSLGRNHVPRINVAFLVLEAPENLPMIKAFVASLGITDPVAIADADTIAGKGPFTGLHHVPSVVILDQQGREVWRHLGILQERELEQAVRAVEGPGREAR
jgi:hypothetical protein